MLSMRQCYGRLRPFILPLRDDLKLAAMRFDDRAAERKADAHAAGMGGARLVAAIEEAA